MAEYRLSREAERDLLEIGRYTQREWGVEQRRHYLARLDRRMAFLAEHPKLGATRDDVRPGYRSFKEGRHLIFYRETAERVSIVRILHESMDAV